MKQLSLICYLRGSNIVFTWFAQSLSIRWIRESADNSLIREQFVGFENSLDSRIRGQFVGFVGNSLDPRIRGKFVDSWAVRFIRLIRKKKAIR